MITKNRPSKSSKTLVAHSRYSSVQFQLHSTMGFHKRAQIMKRCHRRNKITTYNSGVQVTLHHITPPPPTKNLVFEILIVRPKAVTTLFNSTIALTRSSLLDATTAASSAKLSSVIKDVDGALVLTYQFTSTLIKKSDTKLCTPLMPTPYHHIKKQDKQSRCKNTPLPQAVGNCKAS